MKNVKEFIKDHKGEVAIGALLVMCIANKRGNHLKNKRKPKEKILGKGFIDAGKSTLEGYDTDVWLTLPNGEIYGISLLSNHAKELSDEILNTLNGNE